MKCSTSTVLLSGNLTATKMRNAVAAYSEDNDDDGADDGKCISRFVLSNNSSYKSFFEMQN